MSARKIVVVGSSNTDLIVQVPRTPRPGETITGGNFAMAAGGKGANQAVAAARAGGDVVFIGRIGEDMFGHGALESLASDGIDVTRVVHDTGSPSGIALIFVGGDGENSIGVAPGSNARLSVDDIRDHGEIIASADTLLMQLETPLETVAAAANLAFGQGARVILNPAPARSVPNSLFSSVSILTPNETEAEVLTGIVIRTDADAFDAADRLRSKGVGVAIITLGARGACVVDSSLRDIVPGFRVEAVDTTAAGDVFNGALAVALKEGMMLSEAVRFANAAAALSVTRLGAQPSIPRRQAIDRFLASNQA
jgi:ribokinase